MNRAQSIDERYASHQSSETPAASAASGIGRAPEPHIRCRKFVAGCAESRAQRGAHARSY